jgi:hypothetical protein
MPHHGVQPDGGTAVYYVDLAHFETAREASTNLTRHRMRMRWAKY